MKDFRQLIQSDEGARAWKPEIRAVYSAFYDRLAAAGPLAVRIGKGGLSFYGEGPSGPVFVCHFNAEPRKGERELGFADFRADTLGRFLDVESTIAALREAAPPEVRIKVNQRWCSLHFPLAVSEQVADLFREHVIQHWRKGA